MDHSGDQRILIVDDDQTFCTVMERALERRGYVTAVAHNATAAIKLAAEFQPHKALIDLVMPGDTGLVAVKKIHECCPQAVIVVLTGYASISTAVESIKLGAVQYLTKPVDVDKILDAFSQQQGDEQLKVEQKPLSPKRLEWEHIQKVLAEHDGNISATARALNMHRRTLQRKLAKKPVRD